MSLAGAGQIDSSERRFTGSIVQARCLQEHRGRAFSELRVIRPKEADRASRNRTLPERPQIHGLFHGKWRRQAFYLDSSRVRGIDLIGNRGGWRGHHRNAGSDRNVGLAEINPVDERQPPVAASI